MFKKIFASFFIALLAFSAISPGPVFAQTGVSDLKTNLSGFGQDTGLGSGNPKSDTDLKGKIAGVINIVLGFLGVVAVIIVIVGGYKWITANGNEEQVKSAKGNIINAVIGIGIVLTSFVVVNFAVDQIGKAADGGTGSPGGTMNTGNGACIYVKRGGGSEESPQCENKTRCMITTYAACEGNGTDSLLNKNKGCSPEAKYYPEQNCP